MGTFAIAMGLLVFFAFYVGPHQVDNISQAVQAIIRWASSVSLAAIVVAYAAWRWVPAVQLAIFPYLGGKWEGEVHYQNSNGDICTKLVTMEAKHTLFGIKFLLESDESTSATLVVHAEKDPDFSRYRLFYVYLNRRKEGVLGAGDVYQGLAVTRWLDGSNPLLEGDYFTDTHRRGTLHLHRVETPSFWKLWR